MYGTTERILELYINTYVCICMLYTVSVLYVHVYVHVYIHEYLYVYCMYTCMYMCTYMHALYVYCMYCTCESMYVCFK